eukprot:GHUV01049633.1.p1 GENE.GHUV01049633.1~~GHUV01049633.1.p1  ORF type:complete len:126 (-),score=21.56 GHUV01049633.1:138-515(-)
MYDWRACSTVPLTCTPNSTECHAGMHCSRQVSRWSKQYVASMPQPCPAVLRLIDWLQQHVPAEDAAPPAPALVHGDYRLDNLVFGDKHQVSTGDTVVLCGGLIIDRFKKRCRRCQPQNNLWPHVC